MRKVRVQPLVLFVMVVLAAGSAEAQKRREVPARPGGVGTAYEVRTFKGTDGRELSYGWLAPLKAAAGRKYPLVVCLHGRGGNTAAADVLAGAPLREKHPCYVFVPGCDKSSWWAGGAALNRPEEGETLPLAIEALESVLKNEAIDATRVYVTGQSMGGFGTWGAIARRPELFAAAVPICGGWVVEDAEKMKDVPVWAFHGEKDTTVPVRFSRELTAAVEKAGGQAKYTEYPGVGHGSWNQTYANDAMWNWMFEQHK